MKRYTIVKDNIRLDSFMTESLEALDSIIEFRNRIEANTWGRRYDVVEQVLVTPAWTEVVLVAEATETELAEYETVEHEAIYENIIHPAEFEIIEEDIEAELVQADKLQQIHLLESQLTNRRLREALLTGDHSFIESIEAQIEAIRETL